MYATVNQQVIETIVQTDHPDPFQVLGQHAVEIEGIPSWTIRAFQPKTRDVVLIDEDGNREIPMVRCHDLGFFELSFIGRTQALSYRLRVTDYAGNVREYRDSYAYLPSLGDDDLALFLQGQNYNLHKLLGAHPINHQGAQGVRFAVWAPAARSVSVIGTFNNWDRRCHPMRRLGHSGVWEIFIPGLGAGDLYKFQLKTAQGLLVDKTDPFATRCEQAPRTASIVHEIGHYQWKDDAWLERRKNTNSKQCPMSIYEVHIGSWLREPRDSKEDPNFRSIAPRLVAYVKDMGYTHIELLPVTEHPFGGSWGYQTTGYYAPTSRWGSPEDLMFLVDLCHQNNIGVILDWVPGHFPKDISALGRFDGTALFEHLDPRLGEHPDWGTFIFNYGRNEVRNFLIGSALFWLENYHIDGIRIDAVSSMLYLDFGRKPGQWIPNRNGGRENLEAVAFLTELNSVIKERHPDTFTAAEESTSWPKVTSPVEEGGLGFTYKWNLGWMNDILEYLSTDPLYRSQHQGKLTFSIWYAFSENFILPLSHDEVVHLKRSLLEKMPGDDWKKFANLRLLFGFLFAHPGKKLLFMGGDLAQRTEWNHDVGLPWANLQNSHHHGLNVFMKDLLSLYKQEAALYEVDADSAGFEWVDFSDAARSIAAFKRKALSPDDEVIWIFNFTPVVRHGYRLGIDKAGVYEEILNSDAQIYGGSNTGNNGEVKSTPGAWQDQEQSLTLTLPPLGVLALKRIRSAEEKVEKDHALEGDLATNPEHPAIPLDEKIEPAEKPQPKTKKAKPQNKRAKKPTSRPQKALSKVKKPTSRAKTVPSKGKAGTSKSKSVKPRAKKATSKGKTSTSKGAEKP